MRSLCARMHNPLHSEAGQYADHKYNVLIAPSNIAARKMAGDDTRHQRMNNTTHCEGKTIIKLKNTPYIQQ